MMMQEFIERTGYTPTDDEYAMIEKSYYDFEGDKDAFCDEWKRRKKSGFWDREMDLLQTVKALEAQVDEVKKDLDNTLKDLGNALKDRNYYHKIANIEAAENEKLRKTIEDLEAATPEITICDKSGKTEKYSVQAVCYHDNGISFINVVEPSGWTTSHRIADMAWFDMHK